MCGTQIQIYFFIIIIEICFYGSVVEHAPCKRRVRGSIPRGSYFSFSYSKFKLDLNINAVVVGVDYTNVLHDFGLDFGLKL